MLEENVDNLLFYLFRQLVPTSGEILLEVKLWPRLDSSQTRALQTCLHYALVGVPSLFQFLFVQLQTAQQCWAEILFVFFRRRIPPGILVADLLVGTLHIDLVVGYSDDLQWLVGDHTGVPLLQVGSQSIHDILQIQLYWIVCEWLLLFLLLLTFLHHSLLALVVVCTGSCGDT